MIYFFPAFVTFPSRIFVAVELNQKKRGDFVPKTGDAPKRLKLKDCTKAPEKYVDDGYRIISSIIVERLPILTIELKKWEKGLNLDNFCFFIFSSRVLLSLSSCTLI